MFAPMEAAARRKLARKAVNFFLWERRCRAIRLQRHVMRLLPNLQIFEIDHRLTSYMCRCRVNSRLEARGS